MPENSPLSYLKIQPIELALISPRGWRNAKCVKEYHLIIIIIANKHSIDPIYNGVTGL